MMQHLALATCWKQLDFLEWILTSQPLWGVLELFHSSDVCQSSDVWFSISDIHIPQLRCSNILKHLLLPTWRNYVAEENRKRFSTIFFYSSPSIKRGRGGVLELFLNDFLNLCWFCEWFSRWIVFVWWLLYWHIPRPLLNRRGERNFDFLNVASGYLISVGCLPFSSYFKCFHI